MAKNKITSPLEFMEIVNNFRSSRIILTAYELGLFTLLGSGKKLASEIALQLNTDERATERLMNGLSAMGILSKKNKKFSNSEFSLKFLVKTSSSYMGGLAHVVNLWDTWDTLTEAVIAGTSIFNRGDINTRSKEWLGGFIAAMHSRTKMQAKTILPLLDFKNVKVMIDIGGGSGGFVFEFIKKNKNLKAVVYDLPNVVPITDKYISSEGFSESVKTVPGNYLYDEMGEGYDMAFLSAVIHSNSQEENKYLIQKCYSSLNKGGQIVILDYVMDETRTEPASGTIFAINMLVGTEKGDTYTEKEITGWLKEAGFRKIRRKNTKLDTDLVMGIK